MSGSHILVLGGTGPAGTCLIRELLYREHPTIAYVRNPSKIPHDLSSSPLLQIIKGEMSDLPKHSLAIAQSSTIVLLLGPNSLRISDPQLFADIYSKSVFPLMRERSVKRILAMGTISIYEPEDKPSLIRWHFEPMRKDLIGQCFGLLAYWEELMKQAGEGIEMSEILSSVGWEMTDGVSSRGEAPWRNGCVDAVEGNADKWIGKFPAVSRQAESKKKSD